jgi:hypothetical protein
VGGCALDHQEAGAAMKGWGIVSVVVAALLALGGVAADRLGPATPAPGSSGTTVSSVWVCPHGGGPEWEGIVALANPGVEPVRARITGLSASPADVSETVTVPPGGEVLQPVDTSATESATMVEAFGGWIAVGWLVRAADPDTGLSAEPCTSEVGATWYTTETSTEDGERAYLVVANPFAATAVFDVALFSPDNPPLRDPEWSDLVLKAGRSMALPISRKVVGGEAVGAVLRAKVGRVAVGTLGVTEGGGVRGVLGTMAPAPEWHLPTGAGAGQSSLITFVPEDRGLRFGARLLSDNGPQAAGDLVEAQQQGASTQVSPVITQGPASIVTTSLGEGTFVAAQRATGQSADDAATGGTTSPWSTWVVLPTVVDEPSFPGLVVANPGSEAVTVTLRLLPADGDGAVDEVSFELEPSTTAGAPRGFLEGSPQAAVLVSADGPVVTAGASSSAGVRGLSLYAISLGVAVPQEGPSAPMPPSETAVP